MDDIHNDISNLEQQITSLSDGIQYDDLVAKVNDYGDLSSVRGLPVIESAIKDLNEKRIELKARQSSLQTTVNDWQLKYQNTNGLLEQIIEIKMAKKEVEAQIAKLAPLPAEFANADMFRTKLVALRESEEEHREALAGLNREYFDIENSLPELSYEDPQEAYQEAENFYS